MTKGEDPQAFGRAVEARRGELGMTQQELADAAGVDLKTVYNLESGGRRPIARVRAAISRALGWQQDAVPAVPVTPGADWLPPLDGEAPGVPQEHDPIMRRLMLLVLRDIPADEATEEAVEAYLAAPATLSGTDVFPDGPQSDRDLWDNLASEGMNALQIARVVARVRNSQARAAARPGPRSLPSALTPGSPAPLSRANA